MRRYEQLKRLYDTLNGYIDQYDLSESMISGATADFDRLFELAWKTAKEYLQKDRMIVAAQTGSPKDIIKLAYQEGIINDEKLWLDILEDRNNDSHHYRRADAILYVSKIQTSYMTAIKKLIAYFADKISSEDLEEIDMPDSMVDYCREHQLSVIDFADRLCCQFGYDSYNLIYENWDTILKRLQKPSGC